MRKNIFKYTGYLITLISFYYIFQVIRKLELSVSKSSDLISHLDYKYLLLSGLFYILVLYIGALVWIYIINTLSHKTATNKYALIDVYAKSNISKYIPGNFMQFVGRNILGYRLGYKHSTLALSTIFETLLIIFTGCILLCTLYFFIDLEFNAHVFTHLKQYSNFYLLLVPITLIVLFYINFKFKILSQFNVQNSNYYLIKTLLVVCLYYVIAFILLGLINLFVLESISLTWETSLKDYINILFIFIISWIVGLLMPGAPGGIGVREAIFIFLLSQSYDTLVITLASIIIRGINITGDVCFLILNIYLKKINE